MKRFAVKLLFQFRAMVNGKPNVRRLCEERIIVLKAKYEQSALARAKRRGKTSQFRYKNSDGNPVHFDFVGVLDVLELGIECGPDEVWYDMAERVKPMERRKQILPKSFN